MNYTNGCFVESEYDVRPARLVIVVVLLVRWPNATCAQEADVEKLIAKSDPTVQAQIKAAVNALLKRPLTEASTNWRGARELKKLKQIAAEEERIVEQLAIYAATETREEHQQVLEASAVLDVLELRPAAVIRVLAPYLGAENPQVRHFAGIWFIAHDNKADAGPKAPLKPVNYEDYKDYVSWKLARNEEVPAGFVRYIYERSPGRALLVFAYANSHGDVTARLQAIRRSIEGAQPETKEQQEQYERGRKLATKESREARLRERRELELAEHIVSNAIWLKENDFVERFEAALPEANAELAKLANHEEWWARLYVAHIMRQYPGLRQRVVMQQLAADSNTLVSKAAKSIDR